MSNAKIFISYSHKDADVLDAFQPFLSVLKRDELVDVWTDRDIEEGDEWHKKIEESLHAANIAIVFISENFLASDYIYKNELPHLLRAQTGGELKIFPVFVSPSTVTQTCIPFVHPQTEEKKSISLSIFQGYGTPSRTLAHMGKVEREEIFEKLSSRIRKLATAPPSHSSKDPYSVWALAKFGHLSLRGVDGGDIPLDLDKVFVPLRISQRAFGADLEQRQGTIADRAREKGAGDVELEDVFKHLDGRLCPRVVLFGEPGAGKTTSLKKILHLCLTHGSQTLGLPVGITPIFLRLRHFGEAFLHRPLKDFINQELDELSGSRFPAELDRDLWNGGKLLLLFDGLDEIADSGLRAKVAQRISRYLVGLREQKNIYAAVSCRYAGYTEGVRLEGFFPLDVRPLDAAQVEHFVSVWFDEACKRLGKDMAKEAKERSLRLLQTMDEKTYSDQRIRGLMGNPLLLTLLCVVVLRGGEIPKKRAAFYQKCLEIMLATWRKDQADGEPLLDLKESLGILRPLAWKLHNENRFDNCKRLEFAKFAEKCLVGKKDAPTGLKVLEWLNRDTGVFIEYAPNTYGFMHLGLQEYLAARHAIREADDNLLQFLAGQADEKWWREVFLLLVGIPEHKLFAPLMQLLLPGVLKEDRADLLRELLTEAEQPDFAFFAEALTNEKTPVESLTAILRLLKGVSDPLVLESARKLREHADENISGLARGILGEEGAAAGKDYDLLLIHRPDDGDAARELARMLLEKGLRSWTNPKRGWEADTWLQHLDDIRVQVQAVVFLMGKNLSFWGDQEEAEDGLDYLATDCRLIAFLPAPGRHAKPRLPASLSEKRVMVLDVPATLAMGANILANAVQGGGRSGQKISVSIEDRIHFIDRATAILEPLPGLRLLPVPGEIFTMGDDHGSYDDEKPAHQVELSPYWLAETPVTNQHFGNFLRATKQREPAYWRDKKFSDPQQPVVGVAWHDAVAFCDWLSKESGNKFFLPSEAQWEYAARGTDGRRYPWGNNDPTKELACYDLSTETGKPALVGQYPAGRGPFGHLDLAGNVWEWCRDVWDKDAYKKRAGAVTKDPFVNGNPADAHPVRGGSWRLPAVGLRAAIRVGYGAGFRFGYLGFRLAAPASTVDS